MKIAVGSTNPIKINATKKAFKKVWPKKKLQVVGIEVDTKVSSQPMSDKESIRGARNRAKEAIKKENADFGVGLEGGLNKINREWFDSGWIVIVDKNGKEGIGSTIRMHTPPRMIKLVNKGMEIGEVDDFLFKAKNSKQKQGHFGLVTNNKLNREQAYRDGVISALARFIRSELYQI